MASWRTAFAWFGRPLGLAGRAMLFVTALFLFTASVAVVLIWFGVERENERQRSDVADTLTQRFAATMSSLVARGEIGSLPTLIAEMAEREGVRRLEVHDNALGEIAAAGGDAADRALANEALAHAVSGGVVESARSGDGVLAVAAPLLRDGAPSGVAVIVWAPREFRFNALSALTPFLLFLVGAFVAALILARRYVGKAIAPLAELTRFAESIALNGETKPIALRTGDEFETLANAFNQMIARQDAAMKRIQDIAFVDPVTQLPNQDRFAREVDFCVHSAASPEQAGAVMVFEFQRLTKLLPTLDRDAARDLIFRVGMRFAQAVRKVDKVQRLRLASDKPALAARLGRIEFAVYTPGAMTVVDAARFSQQLNSALNQPFDWRGHKVMLGSSCGVALAHADGADADAIVRHARIALAAAAAAPARVRLFTKSLDREAVARVMLEREMRDALERNEFRAFFQPKINLATGRIEAAEALARWVRPDRTIVGPGRFIPLAEETGLIGPLSDAILREACWKAAAWARAGAPVKMAVNVSALQFRNERFADQVLQVLHTANLPASALELEITESVAMDDPERALRTIGTLREAGVRFAIDDFGCGHSSLAALSRIPFDVVKIDQQFVRGLEQDRNQSIAIIEMILALARQLNLDVVAEGIERRDHLEFLAARGCGWAQGFLYGAAVSPGDFLELLRRQDAGIQIGANAA